MRRRRRRWRRRRGRGPSRFRRRRAGRGTACRRGRRRPRGVGAWCRRYRGRGARRGSRRPGSAGHRAVPGVPGQHEGRRRDGDGDHHARRQGGLARRESRSALPAGRRQPRRRRVHRLGEAVPPERLRAAQDRGPVRDRSRAAADGKPERVRLEPGGRAGREPEVLRRRGDHRRARRQAEQHGGAQLEGAACAADRAALDVPVNPLADRHGQVPVPVAEHASQLTAFISPGAADEQHAQARQELVAGPGEQRVHVVTGDPEDGGDLAGLETLPQVQFDGLALSRVQAPGRIVDQGAQSGMFGVLADVDAFVRHLWRLVKRHRRLPCPRGPQAFVACDGVQPGPEQLRVTQPRQPGGGEDERVLHGVGSISRVAEHEPAVFVQRVRVPVIGLGEPIGVAGHDGRDDLAVAHGPTVAVLSSLRR